MIEGGKMINAYWPVYKRLEEELISMTSDIRFDDYQIKTYSDRFLEILIRISVEIEALSKELYLLNGGEIIEPESDMYFDTVCLQFLEEKWNICKKCVILDGIYFSFNNEENKVLFPLKKSNKRGSSGSGWKRAYQAVKHNRSKNYRSGNMKNCIDALAALYILNLYYKNEEYYLNDLKEANEFDQSQGSEIFSITVSRGNSFDGEIDIDDKSIYCINYTDEFVKSWEKKNKELNISILEETIKDKNVIDAINRGELKLEEITDWSKLYELVGIEQIGIILRNSMQKINMGQLVENQKFYAYLNKGK